LMSRSSPANPNEDAEKYLSNKENDSNWGQCRAKKMGSDEAQHECAGNHECRQGPQLLAGAGDVRRAFEKHTCREAFEIDGSKRVTGDSPLVVIKRCGTYASTSLATRVPSVAGRKTGGLKGLAKSS